MSAKDELLDFIVNPTEEQVEKLFNHFSELSSLLEESNPLYPLEHPLQTV